MSTRYLVHQGSPHGACGTHYQNPFFHKQFLGGSLACSVGPGATGLITRSGEIDPNGLR